MQPIQYVFNSTYDWQYDFSRDAILQASSELVQLHFQWEKHLFLCHALQTTGTKPPDHSKHKFCGGAQAFVTAQSREERGLYSIIFTGSVWKRTACLLANHTGFLCYCDSTKDSNKDSLNKETTEQTGGQKLFYLDHIFSKALICTYLSQCTNSIHSSKKEPVEIRLI